MSTVRHSCDTLDAHPHSRLSRRPPCAIHHLPGDASSRASPDARRPPPRTVWLSAGVSSRAARRRRPTPDGDGGLLVVLTLQRVPHRVGLAHGEPGPTDRRRWAARRGRADEHCDALAAPLPGRLTHRGPARLGLVPHPLALCPPRGAAPGPRRPRGVGGHGPPLAPRARLGVALRQVGGPR